MKALLTAIVCLFALNSCVFDSPFVADAKIPVNPKLLGRWQEANGNKKRAAGRMLVLQHSPNEYLVEYPVGEKAMFFRAFDVKLDGGDYIQLQLIGTANGPVEAKERKYHLLKVDLTGDKLQIRTINPEVLGKNLKDSAEMRAAFTKHKDDPKLFGEPEEFRPIE